MTTDHRIGVLLCLAGSVILAFYSNAESLWVFAANLMLIFGGMKMNEPENSHDD